jgi:threonine dehydrogenase-like Zn-dependent dehydrogenase
VHLPKELAEVGVLVEPLSIATKAGQQLVAIQERFPFRHLKLRGLVLGAGPVGILAGMVLRVHGYETFIYSSESESSDRADLVRSFGAKYVSAKKTGIESLRKEIGTVDVIYEAVGITEVAFRSLDVLGPNGVCILTGIPGQSDIGQVDMGQIMRNLVLKNQLVLGTVNAGTAAYESAVSHLEQFMFLFPESVRKLISRHPMTETPELLKRKKGIKDIIRISA